MGIFDKFATLWSGDGKTGKKSPVQTSSTGVYADSPNRYSLGGSRTALDAYLQSIHETKNRKQLYAAYEEIEETNPEIASILDLYADYAVSGGTHDGTSSLRFYSKNKSINKMLQKTEARLDMSSRAWRMVRAMVQHGDAFYETIVTPRGVKDIKALPKSEMFRIHDEYGDVVRYEQRPSTQSDVIEFAPWQVQHFRLVYDDEKKYGRSLLHSIRQEAQEYALMRTALTVARTTRAHQRLKFLVDVGDAKNETEVNHALAKAQHRNRRTRTINPKTGKLNVRSNPLRAEENIYVPTSKDSKSDVAVLEGDKALVKNIDDMYFKRSGILAGAKISESWLGLTGPNIRNVADHQVINFVKTVRRVQRDFALVAIVPYQIDLLFQGISWDRVHYANIGIMFPKMSLVEDKLRYEIDKLRAEVAEKLLKSRLFSRKQLLISVFELDEQEAERILDEIGEDADTSDTSMSATQKDAVLNEVLEYAEKHSELSASIDVIRFLIEDMREHGGVSL